MIFEYNRSNGGQFKCRVKCMRCTGVLENGDRCPVITCDHLPFCARHLRQKGLEIRDVVFRKDPMYYPEDPGIPGKGLFALQPFKKGARLCDYTSAPTEEPFGELITKEQLDERYGEGKYDYGPYAIYDEDSDKHGDAACSRSAAAYANDSSNHSKQGDRKPFLADYPNNSKFYFIDGRFILVAIRAIEKGDEILCDYGLKYWQGVKATIPKNMIKSGERRYPTYETRPLTEADRSSESPDGSSASPEWWGLKESSSSRDSYDDLPIGQTPATMRQSAALRITRTVKRIASKRNIRKELGHTKYSTHKRSAKRPAEASQKRSTKKRPLLEGAEYEAQEAVLLEKEESLARHFADEFNVFRGFMRSLSGVKDMFVMTKGDQKILLIGEIHVRTFCNHYNYRPLAQFIEDILENSDQPLDFMLEEQNFVLPLTPEEITEAREIAQSEENRPNKRDNTLMFNIDLLRRLVRRYIPHEKANKGEKKYEVKVLPNARVHWIEAEYTHGMYASGKVVTPGEILIESFSDFVRWIPDNKDDFTSDNFFYLERSLKRITETIGFTDECFTTDALFLQATEETNKMFLRKIMKALESSKLFKNCLGSSRRLSSEDYYKCVLDKFNQIGARRRKHPRYYFVFYVQRFLVDVFAMCRIVKKDPRWYKNIVVYAGMVHIENISYMLQENFYKKRDLPPLLRRNFDVKFNPRCDEDRNRDWRMAY